jgi:hypothetical protein
MFRIALISGAIALAACGPGSDVEVKLSANEGVRPIKGSLTADNLDTFQCGDTLGDGQFSVTTHPVNNGCEFVFEHDFEALTEAEYKSIQPFADAALRLKRVELEVKKLDIRDENGEKLELDKRIGNAELWVNGQQIVDVDKVRHLPAKIVLEGQALQVVKDAINKRAPCNVHVVARALILDRIPKKVSCEHESQPTYVMSFDSAVGATVY